MVALRAVIFAARLMQGREMTPHSSLVIWCDMLVILDYALWSPKSEMVAGAYARLRQALTATPEPTPAPNESVCCR